MADIKNVSDKELENGQILDEVHFSHIPLKRGLELDDTHLTKKMKTDDCEKSKEVEEINKNRTEVQTSSYQSYRWDYLPDLILDKILGYLSFHEIAKARMVSCRFNDICKRNLNRGFRDVQNFHKKCVEEIKQEFQELDIPLEGCTVKDALFKNDALFLLLNMTFLKYIEANCFCFIPGKVIDDIYKFLWQIKRFNSQSRKINYTATIFISIYDKLEIEKENLWNLSISAINHFLSYILPKSRLTIPPPRIFSSKTSFKPVILRSFIGSLSFEDIRQHNFLYQHSMEKVTEIYLDMLKEQFQAACFKEYNRLHLLKRDIEVDRILEQVSLNGQSFYLVKWKDINEADFLTYEECSSKFPQILERYEIENGSP